MAYQGQHQTFTMPAGADLSAHTFKAVDIATGNLALNAKNAAGILQNKPMQNEHATIGFQGLMKYAAGGVITKGAALTVSSGGVFTSAASGSVVVGLSLEAAVSGAIASGIFNFANK